MIIRTTLAAMILALLATACHKDNDKKEGPPTSPGNPDGTSLPVVALGPNGGLATGSIAWTLPEFLKAQFKDLDKTNTETALEIELTRGTEKKTARVYSGFSVKPCSRTDETASFVSTVAKPAADGVPPSHRLDVDEVMSWTVESKSFTGRLLLRKSYKGEGDTGIYRVDALVANANPSECVLWNLVFKPDAGTSAKFIEESEEYKALMGSLSTTWEGLGADFDE